MMMIMTEGAGRENVQNTTFSVGVNIYNAKVTSNW